MPDSLKMIDDQLREYHLDGKKIGTPSVHYEKISFFYNNPSYYEIKDSHKKPFYKVAILLTSDTYDYAQRYKNFIYIAGNKEPFGQFIGYIQNQNECQLFYRFNPNKTLSKLLKNDQNNILTDTVKSKTIFAVAAVLEYCHALGISCRFIHPESIFYDDDNNPFIGNIGYSDSILNLPNSAFNRKMVNSTEPLFKDGTEYIVPELCKNFNNYTYQDDVYAFGCLLEKLAKDNAELKKIYDECKEKSITSAGILEKLVTSKELLFKNCDKKEYDKYKKKILNNLCQTKDLKPIGDDIRSLFVNLSRSINRKNTEDKSEILQKLVSAVDIMNENKKCFIPAVYKLACFFESNTDTFIYDIKLKPECFNPLIYMRKAAEFGVFDAPFKLVEMYNRRGLFDESVKVYNDFKNINSLCDLIYNAQTNEMDILKVQNSNIKINPRIPELSLQMKIYNELKKIFDVKSNQEEMEESITNFENEMKKLDLCEDDQNSNYISGKPLYLLSVLFRDGMISEKVLNGIDEFIPSMTCKLKKDDFSKYEINKDKEKYEEYLKLSANYLYEPAVAEYADLLLKKNKIDEAKEIIFKFFSKYNCENDCSRPKIRYAFAKLCEKEGDEKMALTIYKESADRGFSKSHDDYLRLYSKEKYKNPAIIKYYEKRMQRFLNTIE